ncbi:MULTISPECIES: tripartite tricarboxylate transporter substrate binding protein [Micrococcaceae]|uniref:Bug family tripartite tricarboxylate transporter substrate binding protein n=1 Tax=Micrococcaceae TaxID=1268 RepID=UPI001035DE33|nr:MULTISPECIES: tripartite tricarboxylate transporter substrate binding protein [Micrococcaceae]TAP28272.1 tripartite tricarboxylate transporter substrate binding protein [Arthrobacter sp. S41]UXN32932.1 tripartite tricarboxylate transporter substrate binding protein [Glutamicibacter sp. M10]
MKNRMARRTLLALSSAGVVLALSACGGNVGGGSADSAQFPSGPVTLTVGQAPGGSTDLIARAAAEGMADSLGVSMPVVNKPGANGALATKEVAAMKADGQNLVLLNASLITITPLAVSENETVSLDDLDVLMGLSQDDYVMVASKASGLKNIDDIKKSEKKLSFGTTGVGTGSQLAQELLLAQADIEGTTVPFDSGSPALTAVMGDQVQVSTIQLGEAKPQIDAGTVVPITVFSKERNEFLPDVPTAVESGYEVPVSQYRAIAAPKGLSDEAKEKLVASIKDATAADSYKSFNKKNLLSTHEISGEEVVSEWTELAETYKKLTDEHEISLAGK